MPTWNLVVGCLASSRVHSSYVEKLLFMTSVLPCISLSIFPMPDLQETCTTTAEAEELFGSYELSWQ